MSITLYHGDSRKILREMAARGELVDSVVTDPPYGLKSVVKRFGKKGAAPAQHGRDGAFARQSRGFMGQRWDGTEIERDPTFWRLVYDVMKPGAYIVAFSSSRTYHHMAVAIEAAGFVTHPMIGWVFGCLDDETTAVTPHGNRKHSELKVGDYVLGYDVERGTYQWEPIEELLEYQIEDTVYRISTNHGDQIVSRNHRCIVEREGVESFEFAEHVAPCGEARVPILDNLQGLLDSLPPPDTKGGRAPVDLFTSLSRDDVSAKQGKISNDDRNARWEDHCALLKLREPNNSQSQTHSTGSEARLLQALQRDSEIERSNNAFAQRPLGMETLASNNPVASDERTMESRMARGCHVSQSERELQRRPDDSLPSRSRCDEHEERIRIRTSTSGGARARSQPGAAGSGPSHRPQPPQQLADQLDAVRDECGSQALRARAGHRSVMGRIRPEEYRGVIWCVRVRSGAFVASRGGLTFPTGNSGMPKAHNAARAVDQALGRRGSVTPTGNPVRRIRPGADQNKDGPWEKLEDRLYQPGEYEPGEYEPATSEGAYWQGYAYGGQVRKPALEPIYVGQKPFSERNGALNLLKHGVGAVNIDGCRVSSEGGSRRLGEASQNRRYTDRGSTNFAMKPGPRGGDPKGRYPANLIHDGSEDVLALFPYAGGAAAAVRGIEPSSKTDNVFGQFAGRSPSDRRDGGGSAARFFESYQFRCWECRDQGWIGGGTPGIDAWQESCPACLGRCNDPIPFDGHPIEYSAKANRRDRAGSAHPTVKPIDLIASLARHVTPPGGLLLDPFAGSGTTGQAALNEGLRAVLIEMEDEYVADIRRRLKLPVPSLRIFDDLLGAPANLTEYGFEDLLG